MTNIVESTLKISDVKSAVDMKHSHNNLGALASVVNDGPSTHYLGADGEYHEVDYWFDADVFIDAFDVGGGNITAENIDGLLRLNTVNSFAVQTGGKVVGAIGFEEAVENKQVNIEIVEVDVNTGNVFDGALKYLKAGLGVSVGFDGESITIELGSTLIKVLPILLAEDGSPLVDENGDFILTDLTAVEVIGVSGIVELLATNWVSNVYTLTVSALGEYDAIFFSPATVLDKTALDTANIFIIASGTTVTLTVQTTPVGNINLNYFISRGKE